MSIGMGRFRSLLDGCSVFLTSIWYSTPPPTWPRRICVSRVVNGITKRSFCIPLAAVLVAYFFVMDIILFTSYSKVKLTQDSVVGTEGEIYSPFSHLSVKGLLNDHVSQFIIAPSTEYFDTITHFSTTFTFITPNVITYAHFLCGFVSGKFLASDHLQDRRIGVILYEFRTWLDSLDGTVYRSHAGLRLKYHSNHSSSGYLIDSVVDIFGGLFLCLGIFYYLVKRFQNSDITLPAFNKTKQDAPGDHTRMFRNTLSYYFYHPTNRFDNNNCALPTSVKTDLNGLNATEETNIKKNRIKKFLFCKAFFFGLSLAVAGKCWDLAVDDFTNVYEYIFKNPAFVALQSSYSHSTTTLVLFYLWRLVGGQSVLNYVLIAIFMDKTWEFLHYMPMVFLGASSFLYLITFIYIQQVSSALSV